MIVPLMRKPVSSEVRNGAVRIKGGELKITSLKAIAPEEARRRTALRHGAEGSHHDVHRWTGFADAFTHLHTGIPADHSSQKISLARHLQQLGPIFLRSSDPLTRFGS